jgi:hypothetical protein
VPVSNRQSRALGKELVIAGHDYFEAAFYSRKDGKIVRASWELMKNAYVTGLTRDVDYQYLNIDAAVSPNAGAAILFVGKKTDKTLLGIGKLTSTDTGGTTIISRIDENTPGTRSVTFTVAAIECGVSQNAAASSFFTNYKNPAKTSGFGENDTETSHIDIGGIPGGFEKYKMLFHSVTAGEYSFRTVGADIGDYLNGIILADSAEYMKKQPRYPKPGGGFQWDSLKLDDRTKITPYNNIYNSIVPDAPFQNPLVMLFDTRGEDDLDDIDDTIEGSVFALIFQVPVYPLSQNESPGKWYLRASYDSYWLDLDDSHGGSGGAVLMGMGEPSEGGLNYKIVWNRKPYKYKYPSDVVTFGGNTNYPISSFPAPHSTHTGRVFCTHDILIEMRRKDGDPGTLIRPLLYSELTFKIGGIEIEDGQPIPVHYYGMLPVIVEFENPANGFIVERLSYPIICSGAPPGRDYANIPRSHILDYHSNSDNYWRNSFPTLVQGGGGTFIIVVSENVNLFRMLFNMGSNGQFLIMLVSRAPDVTVGRANDANTRTDGVFFNQIPNQNNASNAYYFGTWPFDDIDPIRVDIGTNLEGGNGTLTAITTHPYAINAAGTYQQAPAADALSTAYFVHGANGRLYNVTVEAGTGMDVYNLNRLH